MGCQTTKTVITSDNFHNNADIFRCWHHLVNLWSFFSDIPLTHSRQLLGYFSSRYCCFWLCMDFWWLIWAWVTLAKLWYFLRYKIVDEILNVEFLLNEQEIINFKWNSTTIGVLQHKLLPPSFGLDLQKSSYACVNVYSKSEKVCRFCFQSQKRCGKSA